MIKTREIIGCAMCGEPFSARPRPRGRDSHYQVACPYCGHLNATSIPDSVAGYKAGQYQREFYVKLLQKRAETQAEPKS